MPDRLKEAIKQIRIAEEDIDDPEVTEELEHSLERLHNAVELLEADD